MLLEGDFPITREWVRHVYLPAAAPAIHAAYVHAFDDSVVDHWFDELKYDSSMIAHTVAHQFQKDGHAETLAIIKLDAIFQRVVIWEASRILSMCGYRVLLDSIPMGWRLSFEKCSL